MSTTKFQNKQAIIVHSGGMDSSLCLALAIRKYGKENVLSLSFSYDQTHKNELEQAKFICNEWNVDHDIIPITCLKDITENSLINHPEKSKQTDKQTQLTHISQEKNSTSPTSLVVGRNGLMARLAAILADQIGAQTIYMGVMELEVANSGYRDCSRDYMDLMEKILRIDLGNENFTIKTPLIEMTKLETLYLAEDLGILHFLITNTITCYNGLPLAGCRKCPSCLLRNDAIKEFSKDNPLYKKFV